MDPIQRIKVRRVDFYPDDWLAGTIELSDIECGVYIRACALIYARGGPIKFELLRRACSSHGKTLNHLLSRLEIAGKLVRKGDEIIAKRCQYELERSAKRLQNSVNNGAKGGRPNDLEKPMGYDSRAVNNQQPSINLFKKRETDSKREKAQVMHPTIPNLVRSLDNEFDEVWPLFVRKVGKGLARRAYRTARKKASFDSLVDGLIRYAAENQATETRFILHPATWLNAESWLNEPNKSNGHDISVPVSSAPSESELKRIERRLLGLEC